MYNEHFGLTHAPFRITPDTRLFFPGGGRGDVLDALVYAITSGEGIIKVVGEVGSGKTMLCRMLEERLPEQVEIVYLANPSLTPDDILQAIALEMDLEVPANAKRLQVMHALQQRLLEKHAKNRQVVIFVEEAQSMPIRTLEEIRLLSNLETKREKLLQIVLFGQPELDENLDQANIRQLRERITHSFYLDPLSRSELRDYVNFRMRAVGYRGPDVFHASAYHSLSRASEGLTRRINILADKALLAAFADDRHDVKQRHVRKAIVDSQFERRKAIRAPELMLGLGMLMVVGAIGWTFFGPGPSPLATIALLEGAETAGPAVPALVEEPVASPIALSDAVPETAFQAPVAAELPEIGQSVKLRPSESLVEDTGAPRANGDPESRPVEGHKRDEVAGSILATIERDAESLSTPVADLRTEAARLVDTAPPEDMIANSDSSLDVAAAAKPPADADEPAALDRPPAAGRITATPAKVATTEVTVGPRVLLDQRIEITRTWLRNINVANFSIQVMVTPQSRHRHLEAFLQRLARDDGLQHIYVYETIINDFPSFGVLYGDFPSVRSAKQALENLPASLKRFGPFIRNVSDISLAN